MHYYIMPHTAHLFLNSPSLVFWIDTVWVGPPIARWHREIDDCARQLAHVFPTSAQLALVSILDVIRRVGIWGRIPIPIGSEIAHD
jgi:hypothetical protein